MKEICANKLPGILLAACVVFLTGATHGRAEPQEICPDSPVPKYWVVIDIVTRAGGCTPGQLDEMLKIQDTSPMPVGTELEVCPSSPIPDNWAVVKTKQCAGCCGKGGELVDKKVIKKMAEQQKEANAQ